MRRIVAALVAAVGLSGCASYPSAPAYSNCKVETADVTVTVYMATWHHKYLQPTDQQWSGTAVYLDYSLNLAPDPAANQRTFYGILDHARLLVMPSGASRRTSLNIELRADEQVIRRITDERGTASFEGPLLDRMLASDDDLEIAILDPSGRGLREDRVPRSDLQQADENIKSQLDELRRHIADPDKYCEEIVVT